MEWREQSTLGCDAAFEEAQRWLEEVTKKKFGDLDFRSALENGVLLCDLINRIKPGLIKRVNRLSTPIAGLDNVNVFLKACGKLGLKEAQLFHPGDLQDLSTRVTVKQEETSRRLKNVLITIYWLGRKAQVEPFYNGPNLNLRAFEGLLGIALSKVLEESAGQKGSVRDSGFGDSWYTEREELFSLPSGHRREDSLDSLDSVDCKLLSTSSEATPKSSFEGCGSDLEPDLGFRMADSKDPLQYRRSLVIEPRTAIQFNQFLPSKDKQVAYFPAPLRKKRAERHEENRRSWASPMYTEEDGTFTRSKSVSDIPEEPMVQRQVRYEDLQKIRAQVKECEDKWQEDLTKWKNRRRSINSDIVKKKEEREQMEQFAGGRGARALGGFGQVQEERESKEQFASSTDVCALSSDLEIKPSARNLPDQSCPNIPPETLSQRVYSSLPHGPPNLPVSTRDSRSQGSPSGIDPTQPALADQTGTSKEASQGSSVRASQEQRCYSTRVDERHSGPLYPSLSMDAKPGTARVSVSLPRSYQRSDSSRLTSVVTPRPFGSQSTKISSLPRTFVVDDSHKRFNGEMETHRSSVPNRYSQFVTSEDEDRSQTSSMQSSNEDEDEEEDQRASSFVPQTSRDVIQPKSVSKMNSNGDTEQEHYSDMRVSLSQKANGSQDFGFQTSWDSTGAHVKYIQRGSPAELCQLQVGDEILAVGGKLVSKMSYEEWKGSLDDALQQGSLVLDVRRHGKNNWAQDQPSLPYKSHKTINLTSMDPTLVGAPGNCINSSVELTSIAPTETAVKTVANCEVSSQAVSDLASKGINGGFHEEPVTMRNKEYEPISLRNLKRRSEFFEQPGGSESAISDMPVPSLNAASSRWSWDPEEERRRQEKWQKEQERLLQEKYKRDQERLEEAWRCAQLEAMKIDTKHNQEQGGFEKVGSRSTVGLSSPPGPPSLHAAPLLEEEQQQEVARRERQEEDEHEAVRLQEEERHEQQRGQNDDGWRKMQDADEEKHKENEMLLEQQWAKSKSTSELDVDKPGAKVTSGSLIETPWSRDSQRKKSQHLSQAELERQQILQEMKKKTQLLTDSSWIRQRSTSVHKEPVNLVGPIRRGESLDNLDSARPWRPLSWISGPANYNRPQSAFSASSLGYTCSGASTLPTSLSTGSLRQSPWFQSSASSSSPPGGTSEESVSKNHPPSQRSRSVSGRKMCTLCDLPLGKGAAMIIESLGLCYHLSCFKCVICQSDLGGSESGAEVRIRNGQLYCNDCYVKFKAGQPTTM